MRTSAEFTETVRRGRRTGRRLVAVHLLLRPDAAGEPPRVGFVVSRAVGVAVVRNRVKRRLRSVVRGLLCSLPGGSLLVVRALPQAATADHADLAAELGSVMAKMLRQVGTQQ
jgi:ribonuclease P protein component